MEAQDAKHLKELEAENKRRKTIVAVRELDIALSTRKVRPFGNNLGIIQDQNNEEWLILSEEQ